MSKRIIYFFVLVVLFGCVDPVTLEIDSQVGALVVDASITDQTQAYVVKLSRSIAFSNKRPLRVFTVPERGAVITLSDDIGNSQQLVEYEAGSYRATSMKGVVGRTYTLNIKTRNGSTYTSRAEKMLPVSPIDEVQYEFAVYDKLTITANNVPHFTKTEGFYIYAVAKDPPGRGHAYRWQADGIYEFFSITDFSDVKQCWVPVTRLESKLEVLNDTDFDGNQFRKFVCIVPYDRPTYYMVKMRQLSLTEDAYAYYRLAAAQQTATGSVFDPPPSALVGNIVCNTNPEEQVLGYFSASSVASRNFVFQRFKASGLVAAYPDEAPLPGDCRTQIPLATNIKPAGFPE